MKHRINYGEFPFGRDLAKVSKQFFGALTHLLKDLDIDRHFGILIAIEKMEDGATQQEIADKMRMDKVYMVKVINYLIDKGYVIRVKNKADLRENIVQLTAKGKKSMPTIHNAVNQLTRRMSKGIEKKEMEKFYELLNKVYENLQDLPTDKIIVRFRKAKIEKKSL